MSDTQGTETPAPAIVVADADDVTAAIDTLYWDLTALGCDTLEGLLRALVEPGAVERYRATILEAIAP